MNKEEQDHTMSPPALVRWVFGLAFFGLFTAIMFATSRFPELYEARMQAMAGLVGLGLIGGGIKIVIQKRFDTRFRNNFKRTVTPIRLASQDALRLGVAFVLIGIVATAWSSLLWWNFMTR